jgi:hypothetical protein
MTRAMLAFPERTLANGQQAIKTKRMRERVITQTFTKEI